MSRQKRYIKVSMILGLTAVLFLAGCQTKPGELPQENLEVESENPQETMGSPEEAEAVYVPVVSLERQETEIYEEGSDQSLVSASWEIPVIVSTVEGEEALTLRQEMEAWRAQQLDAFEETVAAYEADARAYLASMENPEEAEFYGYHTNTFTNYTRVDSKVLSFRQMYGNFNGGDYEYSYAGMTFDVETGQQLTLQQMLKEDVDWEEFQTFLEETCGKSKINWYLDGAGLAVIFNPGELGEGTVESFVTIPYTSLAEWVKPEYCGLAVGSGVLPVDIAAPMEVAEGEIQEIILTSEIVTEDPWVTQTTLQVGEQKEGWEGISLVGSARILRQANGRVFVAYDTDMASDDYVTFVYEITGGEILKVLETDISNSLDEGYVSPDILRLRTRLNILGTYSAAADYEIQEDGHLKLMTEVYELENEGTWRLLTTTRELPVTIDGEETMLPVGSQIRLTAIDKNGTVWYREEGTGTEGEIHYTSGDEFGNEWPICIDGLEDFEYFEMLPYAG